MAAPSLTCCPARRTGLWVLPATAAPVPRPASFAGTFFLVGSSLELWQLEK